MSLAEAKAVGRTSLQPPRTPDGTEDILQTASLVWCLGYFVLSLGHASDASYRGRKGTYDYSLVYKRN